MSEPTRTATRELRWEQIQAAIADMLQEGTTPITMVEIARRCDIPRSSLSKEPVWKAAISAAEAERVRRRTEQLQQLRVGFLTPALNEQTPDSDRQVSIDSIVNDLKLLLSQSSSEVQNAYQRGREEAYAELRSGPPTALAQPDPEPLSGQFNEAFERGREAGRSEFSEDLNQAYERGFKDGREGDAQQAPQIAEAYERGLAEGRKSPEGLKEAYERGLGEGRKSPEGLKEAYERGLAEGRRSQEGQQDAYERGRKVGQQEGAAEAKVAYDRGRQMGRAELQVDLKQSYDRGVKDGKSESATDVMNAYDRGRRDGWEEGRREGGNGRGMFGFTVNKSNPDREWALAVLHAPATATSDQLRASYRMLTKAFHPDRNPDLSPEFIRNLNRAKEILGF